MKKGLAIVSGITAAIGSSVLYLKKKDIARYRALIERLGLRK